MNCQRETLDNITPPEFYFLPDKKNIFSEEYCDWRGKGVSLQ